MLKANIFIETLSYSLCEICSIPILFLEKQIII